MTSSGKRRAVKVRKRLRRGAYLLPSLFTMGNILMGFVAIIRGLEGQFQDAAVLILVAVILDSLDGRIARLSGTDSEFGKQFDSLADVLSFGATPALLTFLWGLRDLERIGWLVPLYFLICTTIRLARFNVQTRVVDSRWFVGLPSPAAAGTIAWLLFLGPELVGDDRPHWLTIVMLLTLIVVGSLMVSTFRYPSLKKIDLRQRVSYRAALILAIAILVLAVRPAIFILSAILVYTLAGPWTWLVGRLRHRRTSAARERQRALADAPAEHR